MRRFRSLFAFLAVASVVVLIAGDVMARPKGGGLGMGSRGSRTYTAPPSTATAPTTAAPIQRSATTPSNPSAGMAAAAPAAAGGFFGRGGFAGGLFAGFLGAGLIGMLFGQGLFGGLGGIASFLGLILQVALVVIIGRLIWTWWQRRNAPATAGGPSLRNMFDQNRDTPPNTHAYGGGASASGGAAAAPSSDIELTKADYDDFERLLSEVSLAYAAEDLAGLRSRATPEMVSYFSEDLSQNASRGLLNEVSGIKLEQGDLAEAWREGRTEYATLAMRYSIVDKTVERATGRVVEGSAEPQEVTEHWTFMRSSGGQWILSAIQ